MTERRVALVLLNLGGPDRPDAVRPFLFNLFNDPAILRLPAPVRIPLAYLVARRRATVARRIYDQLGGQSPLLANTQAQARALEAELAGRGTVRAFVAMRYWHPLSEEVAAEVREFAPDVVVLLPLYPQFSTTTTASSLRVWQRAAARAGLAAPATTVCCYPTEAGFVGAIAEAVRARLPEAARHGRPRVLFSAHGLPKSVVRGGDPYQWQCEQTAAAIVAALGLPDLDWVGCYQSRVGPLAWIGPSTDEEIARAGRDGVPLLVAPIAFVSEHSETLVEIEIEYRELARERGVPYFERVPTVGTSPTFIAGLAGLVRAALDGDRALCSQAGGRICPPSCTGCAQAPAADHGASA